MARLTPSPIWPVLTVLTAIALLCPTSARGERIDIDDPLLLGPVVRRTNLGTSPYQNLKTEVRFADGIYSYIYAVETNIYVPHTSCCRASLVSFDVTGHPLEETWGAINSSSEFWHHNGDYANYGQTKAVRSITPLHDGFMVVPESGGRGYTVVYMRSPLRPSSKGTLIYSGTATEIDFITGETEVRYRTFGKDGALVPTPEPGSIVLFGTGLAFLMAKRRTWSRRLTARAQ